MRREFYFQDDRSNKYWTIELQGLELVTTNGRVGAQPRETRKVFASEPEAQKEFEKLIASKIRSGYLEGTAPPYESPEWSNMTMSEDVFWRLIALFNWKKTGDDDAVIEPAIKALAQMSEEGIQEFEDLLAEKLYALDTEAHAKEIGDNAFLPGKYFSPDWFLYVRCCVVANGREFYEKVLAQPAKMPKDMEFEAILYLASSAFERKTGRGFDRSSPVSYETFSNAAGWPETGER
ncbi:MAG: DUF4240 domain-containing protein [Proteobacteria bacterium]|nr:DUF4240 domain-containing protein [Pseudomonadota bacterium]